MKKHLTRSRVALSLTCALTCIVLVATVLVLHTPSRTAAHASSRLASFPLQLAHPQYWYA